MFSSLALEKSFLELIPGKVVLKKIFTQRLIVVNYTSVIEMQFFQLFLYSVHASTML